MASKYPTVMPPIYENMEDWPINQLHNDRKAFIKEITAFTLERLLAKPDKALSDMIALTIYLERARIREEPWKVDPPDDATFWGKIRKKLLTFTLDKQPQEARLNNEDILKNIVNRYAEEIVGTFSIPTFEFARRFLTFFFSRLLKAASGRNWGRIFGSHRDLYERLKVVGETDKVRSLFKKGTVVVVPTHFSNLDSILLGYTMDAVVGLPQFTYGAGLNLYNTGYTAYFMNRLGAYRLDRRKKNPIYLETLKTMSNLAVQRGTNSLFFPGGTRSRSGAMETELKKGLLGSVVEAQRAICGRNDDNKIYVVPLIIGYHFVLEAEFLVESYLKQIGKEHYISKEKDQSYSVRKWAQFVWSFFSRSSDVTLSFGQPMDVLGNKVDADGKSLDRHGNEINIADYFKSGGVVKPDLQRDTEYTKILADHIEDRFLKDNVVLSSHFVAYLAFKILKNQNTDLDLFGTLRQSPDDYIFPIAVFTTAAQKLQARLFKMETDGKIKLSEQLHWEVDKLIQNGIANLGIYHTQKPLKFNKEGDIISENFKSLFYYQNRLENYGLEKGMRWEQYKIIVL
jgi:glycerol-3-phosphate O-acyltransferase